jgi:hypothetical protein
VSASRNFYTASDPQRVFDKVQECRRALAKMEQIDRAGSEEEFLDALGHFLESFRTISQRFYGVVEKQSGRPRMKALEAQLNSHPRIGFIIDRAVLSMTLTQFAFNDSGQQKQCVLFPERMAASSCAGRRVWIGLRSAHLLRSANRQRSQTDCWRLDSRLGQTSGEES